jgi:hypothetical protein
MRSNGARFRARRQFCSNSSFRSKAQSLTSLAAIGGKAPRMTSPSLMATSARIAIADMKMRRIVVIVIHLNQNAVELRDCGHSDAS